MQGAGFSLWRLIYKNLIEEAKNFGVADKVQIVKTGCFGLCAQGPIVVVYPEGAMYTRVSPDDVSEIVGEHLVKGKLVKRLLAGDKDAEDITKALDKEGFFNRQIRVALRNCGAINPENIKEYIALDGYRALGKVLTEMTPSDVIEIMKKSGLRGRGGGGFPTGVKWDFAAKQPKGQAWPQP